MRRGYSAPRLVKNTTSANALGAALPAGTFAVHAALGRVGDNRNEGEVRAVVLGLVVVVIMAALALAFWRRPAPEFTRVKDFRVEVQERENGDPRGAALVHRPEPRRPRRQARPDRRIGGDINADWDDGDVTPRDILDAADQSKPGKPGVIKKDDATVEVHGRRPVARDRHQGQLGQERARPRPARDRRGRSRRREPIGPPRSCAAWTSSGPATSSRSTTATTVDHRDRRAREMIARS